VSLVLRRIAKVLPLTSEIGLIVPVTGGIVLQRLQRGTVTDNPTVAMTAVPTETTTVMRGSLNGTIILRKTRWSLSLERRDLVVIARKTLRSSENRCGPRIGR
jgi:hypothetical protein